MEAAGRSETVRMPERLAHIRPSGIRELFDRARGLEGAIDLSIGQAHFDVPAPVKEAVARALESGCGRYGPTAGQPELLAALGARLRADMLVRPDDALMITNGATGALALALLALVQAGDEVLVPDPYFVGYPNLVHMAGARPVPYDLYDDWRLDPDRIAALITPLTRAIILNSPANPTGGCTPPATLRAVIEECGRRDVVVLSDELYALFSYDRPHAGIRRLGGDAGVVIGGFSKAYGMAGWRLGWAAGERAIIERMSTLQQFLYACPSTIAQAGALAALDVDMSGFVEDYRRKRDRVHARLSAAGYELERPGGAFFAFPRVPWGDDAAFCSCAFERGLVLVPGRCLSARTTHFRMSFAVDDEMLERGLVILHELARRP